MLGAKSKVETKMVDEKGSAMAELPTESGDIALILRAAQFAALKHRDFSLYRQRPQG